MKYDFLEDRLFDPRFEHTYIGYSTRSIKRITTAVSGFWVGYETRTRRQFFDMKFRTVFKVDRVSGDVWGQFLSMSVLMESIWKHTSSPPKILLSSPKAVKFIGGMAFKWLGIDQKDKNRMLFWMETMTPQIEAYDSRTPPFSILRELAVSDSKQVASHIADKKFYDYRQWLD